MRSQLLQRPLRLHKSFLRRTYLGITACVVFGVVAGIGAPVWQSFEARRLVAAVALWKTGAFSDHTAVKGHETSHNFLVNSYDLNVKYDDEQGGVHETRLEFASLFASVDQKTHPQVKYDPQNPERFALSWMVDIQGTIWASIAFFCLIGLGIGALCVAAVAQLLQKLSAARRAAAESEETSVALVRVVEVRKNGRDTGLRKFQYETPRGSGKPKKREVVFNAKKNQAPLFADKAGARMFALQAPAPHQPVVLRNDFYPYDVAELDRPALIARLERQRNEAP